ncbi:ribosomal protein S7, partial [Ramaria rubella]
IDVPPESDPLLAYLTSHLMCHGKRHAAARRTSRMLLHLHAMTRSPPLPIFREAISLAAPSIRIVSHKQGGKNVQKPVPLGEKQRTRFAIQWMLAAAKTGKGRTIEERLAREVLAIIKGGAAQTPDNEVLKKKQDVHKLGMVNR